MENISEKVKAGVLNLTHVPTDKLIQMQKESTSHEDQDVIGCEIMYR